MVRTYPALWLLGAIVLCIAVADRTAAPDWLFAILTILLFAFGLLARRRWFGVALLLLAIGMGSATVFCLRYRPEGVRHLASVLERSAHATVYGSVADWPTLRDRRTDIPVAVDSLHIDKSMYGVEGGLLLTITDTTTLLQRGDRVVFRARLYPLSQPKRSGFNYSRYLSLKGIFGRAYLPTLLDIRIDRRSTLGILSVVDRLRDQIIRVFDNCLTPKSAALANGLLLGETRGVDPHVYAMFRDSGTLHLLAVSGSNVALVLFGVLLAIKPLRMPLKVRHIFLLMVILVYALLCHLEPSVIRASVMASLVIVARMLHRKTNLNQIIAATAVLILLYDPGQMFDVGFQLSFVTAWGLIFIVPKITSLFQTYQRRRWYRWLVFPLIISLVAQVVSTPLSVLYFQRLPLISVPANLVVVPLVSICVMGLAAVLGAYLLHPLVGLMVGSWVDPLHRLTVWALEQMGGGEMPVLETDLAFRTFPLGWSSALLAYSLIVLFALAIHHRRIRRMVVFVLLALTLGSVSVAAFWPTNAEADSIYLHRVAGGLAAIRPLPSGQCDLLVSSARTRDYPLDSVVLEPLLKQHGIDSIHYLFLQDIEYGALDELWRLAVTRRVDSVFVEPIKRASLTDIRRTDGSGHDRLPSVVVLLPVDSLPRTSGYAAVAEGIILRIEDRGVLFSVRAPSSGPAGLENLRALALVVSRRWQPAPADWANLAGEGLSPIIAGSVYPRTEQPARSDEPDVGEVLPDFIVDLNRQGSIGLTLSDNSWHPLH